MLWKRNKFIFHPLPVPRSGNGGLSKELVPYKFIH